MLIFTVQRAGTVKEVRCWRARVSLGRAPSSAVGLFDDPEVSRDHAEVECVGGRFVIRDLNSSNGTYVNGRRVAEQRVIEPGDVIEIGEYTLLFRYEEEEQRTQVCAVVSEPAVASSTPAPTQPPPLPKHYLESQKLRRAAKDQLGAPGAPASITRYPTLDVAGQVRPGGAIVLTIDLLETLRESATQSSGVAIRNVDPDWQELDLAVRLTAPGLIFAPGDDEGVVRLRRDLPALTCVRDAVVDPELLEGITAIDVMATFSYGGRCCGSARRVLEVSDRVAPPPPEPGSLAVSENSSVIAVDTTARAPALTVKIYRPVGSDPTTLYWVLDVAPERRVPALRGRFSEAKSIGAEPAKFVQSVFGSVPGRMDDALLRGLGERLYDAAPRCFHDVYTALRQAWSDPFPIQFLCDEPHVPWELMCPYGAPHDGEFLAKRHPVARWYEDYHGYLTQRIRPGVLGTVAPDYGARSDMKPLDSAQRESEGLERELKAIRIPGRKARLLALLEEAGPITMIHFAGHGSPRSLFLEDEDLEFLEIRAQAAGGPRFVLLNACGVGCGMETFGTVSGWAAALMRLRCGAVLAPAWAVWDGDAEGWVAEFMRTLVQGGLPISEALRRVRESHGDGSGAVLAYVLHGDVMACIA